MNCIKNSVALIAIIACVPSVASAIEYNTGKFSAKLTGYATSGIIEPELKSTLFIGDWRAREQITYAVNDTNKLGFVYAMDQAALDKGNFSREAFALWEVRNLGRIEIGYTDSVARKLGVGLPDVGGLRINDRPLYNEKITPDGPIIPDTTLTSGRNAPRINLTSAPNSGLQYGFSATGFSDDYDWALDAGLKLRRPHGKIKTAYSLGVSFMDNPDGFDPEVYMPAVTADWRAQMSLGMNLQYNSLVWGLTGRAIYDQNPIGIASDGFVLGTGVSYDLLKYTVSLTYMFSDTGVWHKDAPNFQDNTVVASFRYKYSENVDLWMSGGTTSETPFFSAGLRLTF